MKPLFKLTFILFLFFSFHAYGQSHVGNWNTQVDSPDGGTLKIKASILADGTYSLDFNQNGSIEVQGKYDLEGNQMTIWDVGGEMACPSDYKGNYSLSFNGNQMIMTLLSDQCEGRGAQKMIWTRS